MPKRKDKSPSFKRIIKSVKPRVKINKNFQRKLTGLLLIFAALILLTIRFPASNTAPAETNSIRIDPKLLKSESTKNIPVKVLIPKLNIDLNVTPSKIVNGYWEISESSASYGLGSGIPKTNSNTVIFAHAREGLFYNLREIDVNDAIYVLTEGQWYKYKVSNITQVYPNEIKVIGPTEIETLTLYTCTGFNDEKRLVITAHPQE